MLAWFVGTWLVLSGLYLAFAGQLTTAEIAVALCGGMAMAAYRLLVSRAGRPYSSGLIAGLGLSPRIVMAICRDTAKLTLAFVKVVTGRVPHGSFVDIEFASGDGDAPSRCRRSLVVSGISFAPNTFVVAVRRPQRQLTLHALLPVSAPKDVRWPL